MFEEMFNLVKQYAGDSVINNNDVPNEHNEAVIGEATKSITRGIQGLVAQGHSPYEIVSMFGSDGNPNTPAAQGISANFMGSIMEKFGLSSSTAKSIATALIPLVLAKIMSHRSNTTIQAPPAGPPSNTGGGFDLGSIFGSLFGR